MPAEYEVGLRAVSASAHLCEAVRAEMVVGVGPGKLNKHDQSPVTVADFGVQAVVCRLISEVFPDDVIIAEEDSTMLRKNSDHLGTVARFVGAQLSGTSEEAICHWIDRGSGEPGSRFWVLDPIDGTKGFLRHDQYAIALALIEEGVVQWGFLVCPALPQAQGSGVMFVAQHNAGTTMLSLDGEMIGPAWVSHITNPTQARLAESVEAAHTNHGLTARVHAALGITATPVRMDSQAKYGAVARGQADVYLRAPNDRTPDYREHIWDHAAGWLVVTEAGGKVTDVYGEPLDWTQGRRLVRNKGVLATNSRLHDPLIAALASLLPPR